MWKLYHKIYKQSINNQLTINTLIQFIMKKIFFVAIAATLLAAGCQKTEVLNQVNPVDGSAMTFASNMGKLTKASAEGEGMANLIDQDFRLWAYYVADDPHREDDQTNQVYDGMSNIWVKNEGENSGWNATTTHFWPGKGKLLKFFAISADATTYGNGEGTTATDSKVTVDPTANEMTVSAFTVIPSAPDTDLMVADYVEAKQKESDGETNTVKFNFRHALTKVQFTFKNTDASKLPVYVQQMYVEEINTVADLTVKGASAATTMTWGVASVPELFAGDYVNAGATTLVYEEAENISDWNAAVNINDANYMLLTDQPQVFTTWLVIPQDVFKADTKDLKVTIAYVIETEKGNRQFVQTFSLGSAAVVPTWDQNQYVKYNINLTPNIIGFDADVEDWDETSTGSDNGDVNIND